MKYVLFFLFLLLSCASNHRVDTLENKIDNTSDRVDTLKHAVDSMKIHHKKTVFDL